MSSPSDPFHGSTESATSTPESQYASDYRPTPDSMKSTRSAGLASPTVAQEDSRLLASPTSPATMSPHEFGARTTRLSPLNPTSTPPPTNNPSSFSRHPHSSSNASMASRPASMNSSTYPFMAAGGMGAASPLSPGSQRGSMILYRLAGDPATVRDSTFLQPPKLGAGVRDSYASSSGDSIRSFTDSKYPSGIPTQRGLIPYEYDPAVDELGPPDEEDLLHDPDAKMKRDGRRELPWRGIANVTVLVVLILGLLCLFVFYPVLTAIRDRDWNRIMESNLRINGTGQSPFLFQMPEPIDRDTPPEARTRTGFDGLEYDLVFSDEFNVDNRSFYAGDDPFWEAVDLWYGATGDLEWYDPQQVTTRDGHLIITIDSTATTQGRLSRGSTAPFTAAQNHDLEYRSGMIQTWNKFCFTSGYIEVSVTFPGPDQDTAGYWPGAWTMGNLARPGYPASTEGMWPYTYDTCDLGTFPNQTRPDGSGPAAALFSEESRSRYHNELSWLAGQRVSACTCPGEDHPGPRHDKGRGAPEIDIFEASRDKSRPPIGGTVSQSAQFAPFTHDYLYLNESTDYWENFNSPQTRPNGFRGSAVQQSVSGVTRVPSDMFQGLPNKRFVTFGFEYWANPSNIEEGYVWWQVDGNQTHRIGARAMGADPEEGGGAGIGQRLIPEEPMAIILNLGMSPNWQEIHLETMSFPGEMLVDYVRVYQRRDAINVGCDPKDYPTKKYIEDHLPAYSDVNMTAWQWPHPRNSLLEGCD
ncbi:beta-glucan synthesis-associated protein-domain-containing protein [Coprinopsis sp. MPI-PUGE-AT-0042]|nr:beta-glucan synthesis-associated protein-domain-containing protein [Coprinopsis sp. MPI-PUGE-AT-0042]